MEAEVIYPPSMPSDLRHLWRALVDVHQGDEAAFCRWLRVAVDYRERREPVANLAEFIADEKWARSPEAIAAAKGWTLPEDRPAPPVEPLSEIEALRQEVAALSRQLASPQPVVQVSTFERRQEPGAYLPSLTGAPSDG